MSNFVPPHGWRASTDSMSELIDRTDWSATPLGARNTWSASLTWAVDMVLASAIPMGLRWGLQFVLIYNDAYRPILGDKHPWALGRPAREAWSEVWAQIAPAHDAILNAETRSIVADDIVLRIKRHNLAWEDAHFTLGYSAIKDVTTPSGVGGVLVTALDNTERKRAEDALRDNRSFLNDILKSSGEAFYALARDGSTTLCNHALLTTDRFRARRGGPGSQNPRPHSSHASRRLSLR